MSIRGYNAAQKLFPLRDCERCGKPGVERHHKDRNPDNNDSSNIEILCDTCHQRIANAIFTPEEVVLIRNIIASGVVTQIELARLMNVGRKTISGIVRGDTWQDVGGPIRESERLTAEQDALIMSTYAAHPDWTTIAIARACGVSFTAVRKRIPNHRKQ